MVKHYPPPKYPLILEPFAGSARYALEYYWNDVILVDRFHKITEAWKFLQQASFDEVMALPDIDPGDDLRNYPHLPDGARWLIGFGINAGTSNTRYKVTGTGTFNRWKSGKARIAGDLYKIRHWQIVHGSYECLGNVQATWYVDPPYSRAGHEYVYGSKQIDYPALAEWCKSRQGQVIVCENMDGSNWLPFAPLKKMRGSNFNTVEAVYIQDG